MKQWNYRRADGHTVYPYGVLRVTHIPTKSLKPANTITFKPKKSLSNLSPYANGVWQNVISEMFNVQRLVLEK
jgi:hypothetical protein